MGEISEEMSGAVLEEEFHDTSERRVSATLSPHSTSTAYRHSFPLHSGYALDSTDVVHKFMNPYAEVKGSTGLRTDAIQKTSVPDLDAPQSPSSIPPYADDDTNLHRSSSTATSKRPEVRFAIDHSEPPFMLNEGEPTVFNIDAIASTEPSVGENSNVYTSTTPLVSSTNFGGRSRAFSVGGGDVSYPDFLSNEIAPDSTAPHANKTLGTYLSTFSLSDYAPLHAATQNRFRICLPVPGFVRNTTSSPEPPSLKVLRYISSRFHMRQTSFLDPLHRHLPSFCLRRRSILV